MILKIHIFLLLFKVSNGSQGTNDITDKNEGYKSLPSATPCNSTWLDNNLNTVSVLKLSFNAFYTVHI